MSRGRGCECRTYIMENPGYLQRQHYSTIYPWNQVKSKANGCLLVLCIMNEQLTIALVRLAWFLTTTIPFALSQVSRSGTYRTERVIHRTVTGTTPFITYHVPDVHRDNQFTTHHPHTRACTYTRHINASAIIIQNKTIFLC